ncbi:PilW family protein [Niveibacterium sp. SC-1]|uniref:PilW family protein n=1 Tax=Niveibacterium sp. SC-1 TaxID=3135646 RepID=UPI00311E0556
MKPTHPSRSSTGGFTLVEVMVALTVGLLISGVVVAVFLASSGTSRVADNRSRIQESFRYASFSLGRDSRMAGFVGCNRDIAPANQVAAATSSTTYTGPLQGYENSQPTDAGISGRLAGTDVLRVQYSSNDGWRLNAAMATADDTVALTAPAGTFALGDTAVISDCGSGAVFTVTGASASSGTLTLQHQAGSNTTGTFPRAYDQAAEVFDLVTSYFFLRDANGRRTLVRRTLRGTTQQDEDVAEGVDDFQLLYGQIDAAGTGMYISAEKVTNWNQVRAVRVCMITRSTDSNVTTAAQKYRGCDGTQITPTDRILRTPVFFTISLRNRL